MRKDWLTDTKYAPKYGKQGQVELQRAWRHYSNVTSPFLSEVMENKKNKNESYSRKKYPQ